MKIFSDSNCADKEGIKRMEAGGGGGIGYEELQNDVQLENIIVLAEIYPYLIHFMLKKKGRRIHGMHPFKGLHNAFQMHFEIPNDQYSNHVYPHNKEGGILSLLISFQLIYMFFLVFYLSISLSLYFKQGTWEFYADCRICSVRLSMFIV